jgi:hypothetical protein
MTTPNHPLFSPLSMPPRDKDGMCCHPDIDDRWNMDDDEQRFDPAKFAAAGWAIAFIWFESDGTEEELDRYCDAGDADISYWTPSSPPGAGWMLCGVWDTEDMPVAFYVKPLVVAA